MAWDESWVMWIVVICYHAEIAFIAYQTRIEHELAHRLTLNCWFNFDNWFELKPSKSNFDYWFAFGPQNTWLHPPKLALRMSDIFPPGEEAPSSSRRKKSSRSRSRSPEGRSRRRPYESSSSAIDETWKKNTDAFLQNLGAATTGIPTQVTWSISAVYQLLFMSCFRWVIKDILHKQRATQWLIHMANNPTDIQQW